MFLHLFYVAIYSILVISLLISYDIFIKNFKKLNLYFTFKVLIGSVLFISQVYFIISFSLNSIGYIAYEYSIPIFIYYFGSLKEKFFLIVLVPIILITFFYLIDINNLTATLYVIGLNSLILTIVYLLKNYFHKKNNHNLFYIFSVLITLLSPIINSLIFFKREVSIGDSISLSVGAVAIIVLWKYYIHNQTKFLENINTKIIERNYDELTQLKNLRSLNEDILKLASNENQDLVFAMIDIDYFKKINDQYGHQIGNKSLIFFSNKLISFLYQHMNSYLVEVYRYGGEEFLVIFKENNVDSVKEVLEDFQLVLGEENMYLENAKKLIFSFSAGISEVKLSSDISEVINQADKALYKAKQEGRGRVFVY